MECAPGRGGLVEALQRSGAIAPRTRAASGGTSSSARSTSSGVEDHPTEKRRVLRASAGVSPIAASTDEGVDDPEWQALPAG